MAAEFEGHGQLVADLKGLVDQLKRGDALEGLKSCGFSNKTPDLEAEHLSGLGVRFEHCNITRRNAYSSKSGKRRHDQQTKMLLILTYDHALVDQVGLQQLGLDRERLHILAA